MMVVLATAAALSSSCTRGEGYDLAGGDLYRRKNISWSYCLLIGRNDVK